MIDIAALMIDDGSIDCSCSETKEKTPVYAGRDSDTTVLAFGTTFCGDVKTQGHIEIAGTLLGSAEACKNIIVSGKIEGNVFGDCILLHNCAVKGSVTARGELNIEEGSIVSGNIAADAIALGGKICGNIKARGAVVLRTGACVVGDIEADTITMKEGCALFGSVAVLSKESEKLTKEAFDALIDDRK